MRVFKFGGASVKNSEAVRNVAKVLKMHNGKPTLVVISAMGKTTNMLESLVAAYSRASSEAKNIFNEIKKFHTDIIDELIEEGHDYYEVDNLFIELECIIDQPAEQDTSYDKLYDRIVPFGELISTKIVSIYLSKIDYPCRWVDARNFVITNNKHRSAKVKWNVSNPLIANNLKPLLERQSIITQGFIGRNELLETTTLGREGSDYSAAIFAYALDAESVTIWKDVDGVMNADPKRFEKTTLLKQLSFNEAIELAYYGASVIHPKTIQPLKSKGIPLYVKSFLNPDTEGTQIIENDSRTLSDTQCYIIKDNQCLIKISTKDFSFIVEDNLEHIFSIFSSTGVQMNLMQNSAISFMACVNQDDLKIVELCRLLGDNYNVDIVEKLKLFTVFNYQNDKELSSMIENYEQVLEQKSQFALQLVLKD
ncbi:MAG: aspartate kinase [Bacteroidia bacterium]